MKMKKNVDSFTCVKPFGSFAFSDNFAIPIVNLAFPVLVYYRNARLANTYVHLSSHNNYEIITKRIQLIFPSEPEAVATCRKAYTNSIHNGMPSQTDNTVFDACNTSRMGSHIN